MFPRCAAVVQRLRFWILVVPRLRLLLQFDFVADGRHCGARSPRCYSYATHSSVDLVVVDLRSLRFALRFGSPLYITFPGPVDYGYVGCPLPRTILRCDVYALICGYVYSGGSHTDLVAAGRYVYTLLFGYPVPDCSCYVRYVGWLSHGLYSQLVDSAFDYALITVIPRLPGYSPTHVYARWICSYLNLLTVGYVTDLRCYDRTYMPGYYVCYRYVVAEFVTPFGRLRCLRCPILRLTGWRRGVWPVVPVAPDPVPRLLPDVPVPHCQFTLICSVTFDLIAPHCSCPFLHGRDSRLLVVGALLDPVLRPVYGWTRTLRCCAFTLQLPAAWRTLPRFAVVPTRFVTGSLPRPHATYDLPLNSHLRTLVTL